MLMLLNSWLSAHTCLRTLIFSIFPALLAYLRDQRKWEDEIQDLKKRCHTDAP